MKIIKWLRVIFTIISVEKCYFVRDFNGQAAYGECNGSGIADEEENPICKKCPHFTTSKYLF